MAEWTRVNACDAWAIRYLDGYVMRCIALAAGENHESFARAEHRGLGAPILVLALRSVVPEASATRMGEPALCQPQP